MADFLLLLFQFCQFNTLGRIRTYNKLILSQLPLANWDTRALLSFHINLSNYPARLPVPPHELLLLNL